MTRSFGANCRCIAVGLRCGSGRLSVNLRDTALQWLDPCTRGCARHQPDWECERVVAPEERELRSQMRREINCNRSIVGTGVAKERTLCVSICLGLGIYRQPIVRVDSAAAWQAKTRLTRNRNRTGGFVGTADHHRMSHIQRRFGRTNYVKLRFM